MVLMNPLRVREETNDIKLDLGAKRDLSGAREARNREIQACTSFLQEARDAINT